MGNDGLGGRLYVIGNKLGVSVGNPEGGPRSAEGEGRIMVPRGGWLEYGISGGDWYPRRGDGTLEDGQAREAQRIVIEDLDDLVVVKLYGGVRTGLYGDEGEVVWLEAALGGGDVVVPGVSVVGTRDFGEGIRDEFNKCECLGIVLKMDRGRAYRLVIGDRDESVKDFDLGFREI